MDHKALHQHKNLKSATGLCVEVPLWPQETGQAGNYP